MKARAGPLLKINCSLPPVLATSVGAFFLVEEAKPLSVPTTRGPDDALRQYVRIALPAARESITFARRVGPKRLEKYRRILEEIQCEAPSWPALREHVNGLREIMDAAARVDP